MVSLIKVSVVFCADVLLYGVDYSPFVDVFERERESESYSLVGQFLCCGSFSLADNPDVHRSRSSWLWEFGPEMKKLKLHSEGLQFLLPHQILFSMCRPHGEDTETVFLCTGVKWYRYNKTVSWNYSDNQFKSFAWVNTLQPSFLQDDCFSFFVIYSHTLNIFYVLDWKETTLQLFHQDSRILKKFTIHF